MAMITERISVRNKTIYGFDLLKFIMAVLIVSIHTEAFKTNTYSPYITIIQTWCVPTFFLLSSYFFMRKITLNSNNHLGALIHFLKRLGILYAIWFIINLPIFIRQTSFAGMTFHGFIFDFIKRVLFASTFEGSWFLGALAVSVVFILLLINLRINKWVIYITCLSIYLSIYAVESGIMNSAVYDWYKTNVYDIPTLSFPRALPFIALGYVMVSADISQRIDRISESKCRHVIPFILVGLVFAGVWIDNLFIEQFVTLMAVPLIVIYFYSMNLPESMVWKIMRDCSILFYLLHFMVIVYMRNIPVLSGFSGMSKYLFVLVVISLIAVTIVNLSKQPRTKLFQYFY